MDQSRVCKVETGVLRLRDVAAVARVARVFRTPAALLGFGSPPPTLGVNNAAGAVSWLERRDFLAVVTTLALGIPAATVGTCAEDLLPSVRVDPLTHVGMADVERIEAATAAFRTLDNQWGGGVSRAAVTGQLQWVVATARHATCSSAAVDDRLLTATADLAAMVAFTNYDVEYHEDARRLWLIALDAAREAGNTDLMSHVIRQMAHQALHLDHPAEALHLAQVAGTTAALGSGREEAATSRAETTAYEGWAHAMAGRTQACLRALGRAEEAFENVPVEDPVPWRTYFDEAELNALHGHSLHVLAKLEPAMAAKAQPLLRSSVDNRGAEHVRRKTLNQIALAATFFQGGADLDEGLVVGYQALAGVDHLSSPRALSRLRGLETVSRPYAEEPGVAAFRQELDAVLTGADRS
jgi:hypothetical protein